MLHIKDINREIERIEEWPSGCRVTERAREQIREVQLNWDSLRSLIDALSTLIDRALLLEFFLRAGVLFSLYYFPALFSILF